MQLTVHEAPSSHEVLQLPPVQLTVQVAPAGQAVVQFPPTQLTVHFAVAVHAVVQLPLRQSSEHSLPVAQSAVQPPDVSPQFSEHLPEAGHEHVLPLHEPGAPEDEVVAPPSLAGVPVPSV